MRALAAGRPGQTEWIELENSVAGVGEIILRPLACGICTTDVKLVRRGYEGGPRYALGHELVGRVVSMGEGAGWKVGQRVVAAPYVPCGVCYYCLRGQPTLCPHLFENSLTPGGLAELVRIPRPLAERGLFPVPDGVPNCVPDEIAALSEPLGCCVQGVETCRVTAGSAVLIVGDGPMGLLCAAVARAYGAHPVVVAGLTRNRLAVADAHYADVVVNPAQENLRAIVADLTGGRGADAVLVAVSSAEALLSGLDALRPGGVLNAFAGVPEGTTVPLDLRRLHYQQLVLTGTFGVGPAHIARALQMLSSGQVNVGPLLTARFPFARAADALDYAARREGFKAVVIFEEGE
ncbi:MAG: alcohol dehydrogenase catalytic domain-containing protein [Chloroflexota bacterium]|nr:alcohol dehydrogenase catalytic domain-containing protein [Chloroflexota bacterium]